MSSSRALVLDGSDPLAARIDAQAELLLTLLQSAGWQVTHRRLAHEDIPPCCGSFACWVKTPGECSGADGCRALGAEMMAADLLVLLTPIVFGSYSAELKKAVDHLIPNISPFMTTLQGETHHTRRYSAYPALLSVGYQVRPDERAAALFARLLERNALNFYPPAHACAVLHGQQTPAEQHDALAEALSGVGVAV